MFETNMTHYLFLVPFPPPPLSAALTPHLRNTRERTPRVFDGFCHTRTSTYTRATLRRRFLLSFYLIHSNLGSIPLRSISLCLPRFAISKGEQSQP